MDTKKDRKQDTSTRSPDPGRSSARNKAAQTNPTTTTTQPQPAADVPDAAPGRQYQGSGVANKAGRFGSSKGPADLAGPRAGSSTKKR